MIDRMYGQKEACHSELLAYATEASWSTGRWRDLEKYLRMAPRSQPKSRLTEFDICVAEIISCLHQGDWAGAERMVTSALEGIAKGLSTSETGSIQLCRDRLRNLHVLYELETIGGLRSSGNEDRKAVCEKLDRRLPVLGSFTNDKQSLLRLRRRAMELSR